MLTASAIDRGNIQLVNYIETMARGALGTLLAIAMSSLAPPFLLLWIKNLGLFHDGRL
jgi:hypothetical protein